MNIYVELLSNLVQTFTIAWFLSKFFGCKYTGAVRNIGFIVVWLTVFVELSFMNSIVAYEGLLSIIFIITYILYAKIFLKGSFMFQIFLTVFAHCIIFTTSGVLVFVGSALSGSTIEKFILVLSKWRIFMLIIVRVVEYVLYSFVIKVKSEYGLTKKEWNLFIAIPLLTWAMLTLLTNASITSEEVHSYMSYAALIMLVINAIIYYFMLKIKRDANTKLEYELLKMQYDNIRSTEANMKALYESTYSLKHDLDKHLFAVKEMAKSKNCEEITSYVERVIKNTNDTVQKIVFTDNDIFNAVVNIKLELCKQKNISTNVKIDKEAVKFLNAETIVVVLGNIFDNAIEAAENAPEKEINLLISFKRDYVSIYIENTFNNTGSDINLSTTKENRLEHGFGVKNIRKAVENNGGMVDFYLGKNGLFCCDVLLRKE